MLGIIMTPASDGSNPDNYVTTTSNGLKATGNFKSVDASGTKYHARANCISPTALLTVDTSRYNNLNQIPNLKIGLIITDQENSTNSDCAWYISDYTGNTNGYNSNTDTSSSQFTSEFNNKGTVIKEASGKGKGDPVYNDAWNKSVTGTTSFRVKSAVKSYYSATIKTTAWNNNFVDINVTGVNKSALRDPVAMASSLDEANYTSASWSAMLVALKNAAAELGNPADSDVSAVTAELKSKMDALKTTVTLKANGAESKIEQTVGSNLVFDYPVSTYAAPGNAPAGYHLAGWATSADATEGSAVIKAGFNPTFYAVWAENTYTVKFDMNGGSTAIADKTVTYTESFNLPSADNCIREGYRFIGWSKTKPSQFSSSPEYVPGQTASGLSDTDGATVTLYAVWAENTANAVDDTVVVEYGLPVEINVLKNDVSAKEVTAIGTYAEKTGDVKNTTRAFTGTSLELENGNVVLKNGKIIYTPTTTNTTAQEFYYEVTSNGGYYYAKVTVIPATSIYYEDTFFKFADATITKDDETFDYKWTTVGEVFDAFQSSELDEAYGYDSAYDNNVAYSGGAAHVTTVDKNVTASVGPTATFTFTGTGFDLFTVTDYYSGMVTATVYSGTQVAPANRVQGVMANAYFGYKYNAETEEYEPADNGAIYQVPVIKTRGLDYGTYTVVVAPRYNKSFDVANAGNCKVYVDSVRIFDPMGEDNETANDAYMADGEYAPEYLNIRETIVQANNEGIFETLGLGSSVYLDGGNADIENYLKNGPKNEVYLGKGNSVAFNIVTKSNVVPATIQLGMRLTGINGASADVKLTNGGSSQWIRNINLNSTTERYYSIDGAVDWTLLDDGTYKTATPVIITNDSDAVISLTSLKWAFDGTGAQTELLYLMSDGSTPEIAMMAIGRAVETEIRETILNPDNISFSFSKDEYIVGDSAMLTVSTPEGVVSVKVNGADAIGNGADENGRMTWTYEFTADSVGSMTFEIIASDENGFTSESVTASTEVKAEETTTETPDGDKPEDVEEPEDGEESDVIEDTSESNCWFRKVISFIRDSIEDIIDIIKMVFNFVMGGVTV